MKEKWKSFFIAVAIPLAVGALSAFLSGGGMQAFSALNKPPLSPPRLAFPVVWTILYILMGLASWLVWNESPRCPEARDGLALYALQLFFNFFWSIIFFNWKQYLAAFIWLLGMILLIWSCRNNFLKCSKTAGNLLVPYLLWCVFAAYLNVMIYLLN